MGKGLTGKQKMNNNFLYIQSLILYKIALHLFLQKVLNGNPDLKNILMFG